MSDMDTSDDGSDYCQDEMMDELVKKLKENGRADLIKKLKENRKTQMKQIPKLLAKIEEIEKQQDRRKNYQKYHQENNPENEALKKENAQLREQIKDLQRQIKQLNDQLKSQAEANEARHQEIMAAFGQAPAEAKGKRKKTAADNSSSD